MTEANPCIGLTKVRQQLHALALLCHSLECPFKECFLKDRLSSSIAESPPPKFRLRIPKQPADFRHSALSPVDRYIKMKWLFSGSHRLIQFNRGPVCSVC